MPRPPVWRMSKQEIIALAKWRCKHRETGLSHYNCYLKEAKVSEKLGFIDIECSNLSADFGIVLSYAIADGSSNKIYKRCITKNELKTCLDKKVVESCIKDMSKFDRLVGYYSSRFDIPFLRTRAIALGLDFPEVGFMYHNDLYFTVRNKLKLSRNRLDVACEALFGSTIKTKIKPTHWIRALMGEKEALKYILDHNVRDVKELKRLYFALLKYRRDTNTSI